MRATIVLAGLLLLSGCAVGPDFHPPATNIEAQFGEIAKLPAQHTQLVSQPVVATDWWNEFHDADLSRLIDAALQQNLTIKIAATRIRQARAERGVAAAELFPHVDMDAGYSRTRGSKNVTLPLGSTGGKGGLPGVTTELYQAGFDANWEIDVFGGTRRKVEAAGADIQAAIEDRRDVLISLLAEVARDYLELRGTQQRLAVARENLASQNEILRLTRSQHTTGLASDFDVTRAAAQASATEATIFPLEARVRHMIHALSTLLARQPNELDGELEEAKPLPALPPEVPVGLPSELLRRRPDIRRAEHEAHAATARIGSAEADLFPKFTLTGNAGLDASSLSHLFEWQSRYYQISPTAVWPIFDAGRVASNIRLEKASRDESVLRYRNTVFTALREVEDALVSCATEQSRRDKLAETFAQSQQALEIARDRYAKGLSDFLAVLDAERTALSAQDVLEQSRQAVAVNLVALYKALGGGWEIAEKKL